MDRSNPTILSWICTEEIYRNDTFTFKDVETHNIFLFVWDLNKFYDQACKYLSWLIFWDINPLQLKKSSYSTYYLGMTSINRNGLHFMFKTEYLKLHLVARGAYDLLTDD